MADPPETYSANAIHLLRTTQNNTLKLSQMADQKASILMGASFVVFSLAVGQATSGRLTWSLGVLAAFAFLSALFGVLAVMPSIGRPGGKPQALNRLFFGHFSDLDEASWTEDVLKELRSDEGTFRTMLHDIYQNGQALQRRKYKYLGYAYRLFLIGLVATAATFAAERIL